MKRTLQFFCLTIVLARPALAENSAPPVPIETHALDFWLGEWEVFLASGPKDGDNRIEKLLGGFAVQENWAERDGHEGKSWFYFFRPTKQWKQIWVTDSGLVKEKIQVDGAPPGGVRFRGEIPLNDGRRMLDQTTLTQLSDGRVRQVIEQSLDGGITWQTVYDANYIRKKK